MKDTFMHHKLDQNQEWAVSVVRGNAEDLDRVFDEWIADSRERSIAKTKLEEAVMWANKAIALHGANDG